MLVKNFQNENLTVHGWQISTSKRTGEIHDHYLALIFWWRKCRHKFYIDIVMMS